MAWFRKKKPPSVEVAVKAPEEPVPPPRPEPKMVQVTLYNYLVILDNGETITVEGVYNPYGGAWSGEGTWTAFYEPINMRWYRYNTFDQSFRIPIAVEWKTILGDTREIIRIKTDDIMIIKTIDTVKKEIECR